MFLLISGSALHTDAGQKHCRTCALSVNILTEPHYTPVPSMMQTNHAEICRFHSIFHNSAATASIQTEMGLLQKSGKTHICCAFSHGIA
jgi:hypothetical protein